MIRSKTVIIVGAGAHVDLGFPSGPKLLEDISAALNVKFEYGRQQVSGSTQFVEALKCVCGGRQGWNSELLNSMLAAGREIRASSKGGDSIDNVIDQRDDNPLITQVGKIAITLQILEAESKSILSKAPHELADKGLEVFDGTWLFEFLRILRTDVRRSSLSTIFENVKVVTFNYDRTLEAFLPFGLRKAYGLDDDTARDIAAKLPIMHAYGKVGALPHLARPGEQAVAYGQLLIERVPLISDDIFTFGEQISDKPHVQNIRDALTEAKQVIFLGFGFHRQNMTLMRPGKLERGSRILGTTLYMSGPARDSIRDELANWSDSVDLPSQRCDDFLRDYFFPITS